MNDQKQDNKKINYFVGTEGTNKEETWFDDLRLAHQSYFSRVSKDLSSKNKELMIAKEIFVGLSVEETIDKIILGVDCKPEQTPENKCKYLAINGYNCEDSGACVEESTNIVDLALMSFKSRHEYRTLRFAQVLEISYSDGKIR
jgi:hypothetical protein